MSEKLVGYMAFWYTMPEATLSRCLYHDDGIDHAFIPLRPDWDGWYSANDVLKLIFVSKTKILVIQPFNI